jgi:hypothetical protein
METSIYHCPCLPKTKKKTKKTKVSADQQVCPAVLGSRIGGSMADPRLSLLASAAKCHSMRVYVPLLKRNEIQAYAIPIESDNSSGITRDAASAIPDDSQSFTALAVHLVKVRAFTAANNFHFCISLPPTMRQSWLSCK